MKKEDELIIERNQTYFQLSRGQWKGKKARISADDQLLEEVKKYCWTLRGSREHPYLSTKGNGETVYLHTFVYQWLYGKERFSKMAEGMVIDHLDNDGLNCCFENLCLTTGTNNIVKGYGIDKAVKLKKVPDFVIGTYHLHNQEVYQLQIVFNRPILFIDEGQVTRLYLKYQNYSTMLSDWFYLKNCLIDEIRPDFHRLRENMDAYELAEVFENIPDDWYIFEKDGELYARIDADAGDHAISIVKTAFTPLPWNTFEENTGKGREKSDGTAAPGPDGETDN